MQEQEKAEKRAREQEEEEAERKKQQERAQVRKNRADKAKAAEAKKPQDDLPTTLPADKFADVQLSGPQVIDVFDEMLRAVTAAVPATEKTTISQVIREQQARLFTLMSEQQKSAGKESKDK